MGAFTPLPAPSPEILTPRLLTRKFPDGPVVGAYQRRYIWGSTIAATDHKAYCPDDPAARLTDCLIDACRCGQPYFLQGITTAGDMLIDGQQRLTYIALALRMCGCADYPGLRYERREASARWWQTDSDKPHSDSHPIPDEVCFEGTMAILRHKLSAAGMDPADFAAWMLDNVQMLHIEVASPADDVAIYKMINGTKAPMMAAEVIKADILRLVSDTDAVGVAPLRARYTGQWDDWARWWSRADVRRYYNIAGWGTDPHSDRGLNLLLKICLRDDGADFSAPVTYEEFAGRIAASPSSPAEAARQLFYTLRRAQKRIEEAYDDPASYNRLKAVLLLFPAADRYRLLRQCFVDGTVGQDDLDRCYKLAFLGMSLDEIRRGTSPAERFDDLYAALSMADVYHSELKREVFNLLLRLNIDEDTKLGRKFDFSVWDNRSLEHIYSKSKVWHLDGNGRVCDGNDNPLRCSRDRIARDRSFLHRGDIVNTDGTRLSEHCIGNLVLLYGANNSEFGNAGFDEKKMMFLAPGDRTVFRSRNLLHSVCVFAGAGWDAKSIVDNYNLTLRNLKIYYGQK